MNRIKPHLRHDKPFLKAFIYCMMILATSHLAISLFMGILRDGVDSVNMFHILAYDQIVPALGEGSGMAALSVVYVTIVWNLVLQFLLYRERLHNKTIHKQ